MLIKPCSTDSSICHDLVVKTETEVLVYLYITGSEVPGPTPTPFLSSHWESADSGKLHLPEDLGTLARRMETEAFSVLLRLWGGPWDACRAVVLAITQWKGQHVTDCERLTLLGGV